MRAPIRRPRLGPARRGFTLIEVVGALAFFAVGTVMLMRLGSVLTLQVRHAGAKSEVAVLAQERVDSLETLPFEALASGSQVDTLTLSGWNYTRVSTVTSVTPRLVRIDVELQPLDPRAPRYVASSYVAAIR